MPHHDNHAWFSYAASPYNYMGLTVPKHTGVFHLSCILTGPAACKIVRDHTDPLAYTYLKALGTRIGVEVAVNTSFNVEGPIAHTPRQALDTPFRS